MRSRFLITLAVAGLTFAAWRTSLGPRQFRHYRHCDEYHQKYDKTNGEKPLEKTNQENINK